MDNTNNNSKPVHNNIRSIPGDIRGLGNCEVIKVERGVAYLSFKVDEMDTTKMLYRDESHCPDSGIQGQYMYQMDNGYWVNYCPICYMTWTVKRVNETSNTK